VQILELKSNHFFLTTLQNFLSTDTFSHGRE